MNAAALAEEFLKSDEAASASATPGQIAQLIAQRQAPLLEVVKASAEYLTNEEDKKRGRGISLLAHVAITCPKDAVTRQEVRTLAEFFTSALASPVSEDVLVPTLEGLGALGKHPAFGAAEAIAACKALFASLDLVGRPQNTRYLTYCLLDVFLAHQRPALKKMGKRFVSDYCRLVTGEKDPRNLRLLFSIDRIVILEFDISDNVEEVFDITFCYFPITFTPPPNDPYGITSENLQASLRSCLAASPRFGHLAIPLFLEKLQANTNTARRQSLQALTEALPVYGKATVTASAVLLWEAINLEIFHANESDVEEMALSALRALLQTVYAEVDSPEEIKQDNASKLARKLCDTCLLELKEADKSNATPATKILAAALSASGSLAAFIAPLAFGQITNGLKDAHSIHQRAALFKVTAQLLRGLAACPASQPAAPFMAFREEVLSLCTSNLSVSETRSDALACLVQLCQLPACLDKDELVFALQSVANQLVRPTSIGDDIAEEALQGLGELALLYRKEVEDNALPSISSLLPDNAPPQHDTAARDAYKLALACLTSLATVQPLFETILIRLLARLGTSLASKDGASEAQHGLDALYAHHLLTTLHIVLERKVASGHHDVAGQAENICSRLYGFFIPPALDGSGGKAEPALEQRVIESAGKVMMLLVQQLDKQQQQAFYTRLHLAFVQGQVTSLLPGGTAAASADGRPLLRSGQEAQPTVLLLYAYPLYSMRQEVLDTFSIELCPTLLSSITEHRPSLSVFEASCRLLSSLLNKQAEVLSSFVNETLPQYWDKYIASDSTPAEQRPTALSIYAWCLRGLLLRSDQRAYDGVSRIIALFADPVLGVHAARTMSVLSKESDGVLTKSNHAIIRLLHKQRFHSFILPKLVEGHQTNILDTNRAAPYLIGLTCLLQSMPKQTMVSELPKLLPLLLRALELEQLDLRAQAVDTLTLLVKEVPESIKHQASSIVSILLKNAVCADPSQDTEPFTHLRICALRCLTAFPDTIDWLTLHQQKLPVLKTLGKAVDDHKKKVRKEAVDCRARWYLFKAT